MSHIDDLVQESIHTLFNTALTPKRFELWRDQAGSGTGQVLNQYAFGEIFWKKSLGHPNTAKRSEGFTVEAWRDETVLVGTQWKTLHVPYQPSWWDGVDDSDYWRVAYMVPGLKTGGDASSGHPTYTHIVPNFVRGIPWTADGGKSPIVPIGLRTFEPAQAVFVKGNGAVHFSFEVVLRKPSIHS